MKIIDMYRESIKKYLDVHDSQLQVCVLEKNESTDKIINTNGRISMQVTIDIDFQ